MTCLPFSAGTWYDGTVAKQVSAACCAGIKDLLAAHPRAAAATLLIGSNDVLASLNSQVPPLSCTPSVA